METKLKPFFSKSDTIKTELVYKPALVSLACKCLIGALVRRGLKQRGFRAFAETILFLRGRIDENPLVVIFSVLENSRPSVNLWNKRVGGTSYQLPYLISDATSFKIAARWFVSQANTRSERSAPERLGHLFVECYTKKNKQIFKRKDEVHRIALSNRAFLFRR